ncbi:MAG: hypothetical protein QW680_10110 [Pyrobaculum sp.]
MCLPEPPYRFEDPNEVDLVYVLLYTFDDISAHNYDYLLPPLFEFAVKGYDVEELFRQLYAILNAWRRFCRQRCFPDFCIWDLCTVKLDELVRAAEEGGVKIDPDFAKAVYNHAVGYKAASRIFEVLEKTLTCQRDFTTSFYETYRGLVYVRLKPWGWGERCGPMDGCKLSSSPSYVELRPAGDGVEAFTMNWRAAIFLWMAFDGVLELYYDGRRYGYKVTFKGDSARRFAKAMLNLCSYYSRHAVKPSEEEYQEVLRRLKEAEEECERQRRICQRAWDAMMEYEKASLLTPWKLDKIAELERRLKEAEEECERSGGSFKACRKWRELRFKKMEIEFNLESWQDAETHCQVAESIAHLAEGAEPPLISEHLRQFWLVTARMRGFAIFYVTPMIEVLETGQEISPPLAELYKRE